MTAKIIAFFLLVIILAGTIQFADAESPSNSLAPTFTEFIADSPPFYLEPTFTKFIEDGDPDGQGGVFDTLLGSSASVDVFIDGVQYVIVSSFSNNGIQIIDMSDITTPLDVGHAKHNGRDINDDKFKGMQASIYLTTVVIDGATYALVLSHTLTDGLQIVDISDPSNPLAVKNISNDSLDVNGTKYDLFGTLTSVDTIVIGGATYALVTSFDDNALTIIDISIPAIPILVGTSIEGGVDSNGNAIKTGNNIVDPYLAPISVKTIVIDNTPYALMSYATEVFQMIDISDPTAPITVSSIRDGDSDGHSGTFDTMESLSHVAIAVIDDTPYALISGARDNGIQIIDISVPDDLVAVASFTNGTADSTGKIFDELHNPVFTDVFVLDGATYAMTAATFGDGIQIIDISDPTNPLAVTSISNGVGGVDKIDGTTSINSIVIDGVTYALITSAFDGGLTIVDISSQVSIKLDPIAADPQIVYSGSGTLKIDMSSLPRFGNALFFYPLEIITPDVSVIFEPGTHLDKVPLDDENLYIGPSTKIPTGFSNVSLNIEIGNPDVDYTADLPIKIILFNQAGLDSFYIDASNVTHPITTVCATNSILDIFYQFQDDGTIECYLDDGDDLIIWTIHLSSYGTDGGGTSTTDDDTPGGGSGNQWNTRPTFGLSHETYNQIVDDGFAFNNNTFTITDNQHTPFARQNVTLGELNSFSAKVYAINTLHIQEFLFGIPNVGEAHKAELGVEVWYDFDGTIIDTKLVQKTNVVDPTSLNATGSKVKCQESDTNEYCYMTNISMVFLEPLLYDVMSIKAIDYEKRYQMTFLNDGFSIDGTSLNPMLQNDIAGTEKYEGTIIVTQIAKYSNVWIAEDGREFERNESGTFTHTNKSYTRHQDPGDAKNRLHSDYVLKQQYEIKRASVILADICPRCNDVSYDKIDNIFTIIATPTHRNYDTSLHEWKYYEEIRAEYALDKMIKERYPNNPFYKDFRN